MKTIQRGRLAGGDRSGASAVELALVLPVLITLVLGAVDFGRFAYTYIAVSNAAREGAATAARQVWTSQTATIWTAGVQSAIHDELGCFNPSPAFTYHYVQIGFPMSSTITVGNSTVQCPFTVEANGDKRVGVSVTYPFQMVVNWPFFPEAVRSFDIQRTVVMRMIP